MTQRNTRRRARKWWQPRASRRGQRWALMLVVVVLGGAIWAAYGAYADFRGYPDRPGTRGEVTYVVDVPRGSSLTKTLEILQAEGVLGAEEKGLFKLYVLNEGAASKVTAGEHTFRGDMSPKEILAELMRSQPAEEVRVTIPEGKHSLQIAQILADAGLSDYDSLVAAMRDPAQLAALGIEGDSIEGHLFPDTYKFRRKADATEILERLVKRHQEVFEEVRRANYEAAEELREEFGWEQREVLTLASIVEKETGVKEERPHIARVFLNRLRFDNFQPKRLETDPTIIYGCTVPPEKSEACQSFDGRIRRIHLRDPDNPYNTYTHEGLPPGPISNPGRAAIEAVYNPRKSRALFFVARNDGTHHFSKTRAEHEAAVEKYIRGGAVGDGTPQ